MAVRFEYNNDYWYSKKPYYKESEKNWRDQILPSEDRLSHSVLLIGDTGHPAMDGQDEVLNMLSRQIAVLPEKMTVVFLGDNIYPKGLPAVNHGLRRLSEQRLRVQLDVFKNFPGRLIFLSGNHDWNRGRSDGYDYVIRQEEFIREYTRRADVYLPTGGCPGPVTLDLTDNLALVIINTQWWVQRGFRPIGADYGCKAQSETHFYELLDASLKSLAGKHILVAAHHPLYSNALHGGRFTLKHHLFPLTAVHKKLYVPLPLAGSLYPLYRQFFGAYEDMSHPRYKRMRKKLLQLFKGYKNLIYAGGHDHNLQYFHRYDNHYIVSGSGSKTAYVHKGGKASFTHAHKGCFRIDYYQNGECWLHIIEPTDVTGTSQEVFRKKLV